MKEDREEKIEKRRSRREEKIEKRREQKIEKRRSNPTDGSPETLLSILERCISIITGMRRRVLVVFEMVMMIILSITININIAIVMMTLIQREIEGMFERIRSVNSEEEGRGRFIILFVAG